MSAKKWRGNTKKIKTIRILLSIFLPAPTGIVFYSLFTGLYREPLFWLGILLIIIKICLFLLVPSLLFTAIMEYSGKKLVQKPITLETRRIQSLLFLLIGTLTGGLIGYLLDSSPRSNLYLIGLLTGFVTTTVKLRYHGLERKASES